MTWKQVLTRMKLEKMQKDAPAFFEASGGFDSNLAKGYSDKTANGLTKCIIEFLELKGHYCNRINSQGQAHVGDIQRFNIFSQELVTVGKSVTWTKGTSRKGTPDVDAIVNGKPVKIEVKVGKDRMSKDQKSEKGRIEKSGGFYFIARDMQSFYDWYTETFPDL